MGQLAKERSPTVLRLHLWAQHGGACCTNMALRNEWTGNFSLLTSGKAWRPAYRGRGWATPLPIRPWVSPAPAGDNHLVFMQIKTYLLSTYYVLGTAKHFRKLLFYLHNHV